LAQGVAEVGHFKREDEGVDLQDQGISDVGAVQVALNGVETMLRSDGYGLRIEKQADMLTLIIHALPSACEECLVPKSMMSSVIGSALAKADLHVGQFELVYPTDDKYQPTKK
jgi:hypothetical protein